MRFPIIALLLILAACGRDNDVEINIGNNAPVLEPPPPPQQPEAPSAPRTLFSAVDTCDPNYDPCVPSDPDDVDCPGGSGNGPSYAPGRVRVVGDDVYDLDRDGDGIGCD
jgi:hypothetical protein